MPEIRTLQGISLEEITDCHNLAFSDYLVPLHITAEQLANSIQANSIKLAFCPGAFDGDKLVGFMLIGIDEWENRKAFYNGGTGVIPEYRGNHLVKAFYEFLLPLLEDIQVALGILEVITENNRAFHIYESLGYRVSRRFLCFKGTVPKAVYPPDITITQVHEINFELLKSFWDWQPSWRNEIPAIKNILSSLEVIAAFIDDNPIGFLIYNPLQKRVLQFAVDRAFRRGGVGTALFTYLAEKFGGEAAVINVDAAATGTISFLESVGLAVYAEQFEMKLNLSAAIG